MPESPGKAVFLSYASQDAEVALRICVALRAAGAEVGLDQEGGLVGGDLWDRKLRELIHTCALSASIVSATTRARHEGCFRIDQKLAEGRSHLIATGKPLIVPMCVDGTTGCCAFVPGALPAG